MCDDGAGGRGHRYCLCKYSALAAEKSLVSYEARLFDGANLVLRAMDVRGLAG